MSEKRFVQCEIEYGFANTTNIKKIDGIFDMQEEKTYRIEQIVDVLNEQQNTIFKLEEEKGYWKSKAMRLLFQVRRLTPRMTDKEVIEFAKELEDE